MAEVLEPADDYWAGTEDQIRQGEGQDKAAARRVNRDSSVERREPFGSMPKKPRRRKTDG